MMICYYGCGEEGTFFNKRKKLWSCSKNGSSCPASRKRNTLRQLDPEYQKRKAARNIEKYGVDNPMKLPEIKQKVKDVFMEKYGVDNPMTLESVRNKIIQTNLTKYGVEYTCQASDTKEKIRNTLNARYGGYPITNAAIKTKTFNTMIKKYGVSNPGQTPQSIKTSSLPRSDDFKNQCSSTWLNKSKDELNSILEKRKLTRDKKTPEELKETSRKMSLAWANKTDEELQSINDKRNASSKTYRSSKKEIEWLDSLNIPERQYFIKKIRLYVDGYDPNTNTVYLFHGDYWHGNPKTTNHTKYNKSTKCTFGLLFEKTMLSEETLRLAGYNVVTMWENDYDKRNSN
jgi:hypothetical protein